MTDKQKTIDGILIHLGRLATDVEVYISDPLSSTPGMDIEANLAKDIQKDIIILQKCLQ